MLKLRKKKGYEFNKCNICESQFMAYVQCYFEVVINIELQSKSA